MIMLYEKIHIVDNELDAVADIRVEDGLIAQITLHPECEPEAGAPVLLPGFTDLHAHFRDPGLTYKEDIESGSRAAVQGGYTVVNLMPNTMPVCSSLEQAREVEARARRINLVRANQIVSMTINELGQDCSHLRDIPAGAIPFVSDDGKGVNRDDVMEEIFRICKEKNFLIMAHEEDARYSPADLRKAENEMTFRDLKLCAKTEGSIHFCHVSTIEAIRAIADKSVEQNTGARGLRAIIEDTMRQVMFDVPSEHDISECIIKKECITEGKQPILIYKNSSGERNERDGDGSGSSVLGVS